jgi:tetratricopeptide (TPR) repeat protein
MESFTTRDVARLLGWSETQVRAQARAGFLTPERGPQNRYRFSFQDLVLLRTARQLAQSRVRPGQIRRALCGLARQLPSGRSLSEIRIIADGEVVLVRDGGCAWDPVSGQLQIDFTLPELSAARPPSARTLPQQVHSDSPQRAWEWFDLAVELEATDPVEASRAYLRALADDPELADAHVNLGRLLQLAGQIEEAIEHYRLSIRAASHDPTGAFNLGTALEELGRWNDALAAYRQAIEADGHFADAHFNLARLYEQLGRRAEAIRHLRTYKRLVE